MCVHLRQYVQEMWKNSIIMFKIHTPWSGIVNSVTKELKSEEHHCLKGQTGLFKSHLTKGPDLASNKEVSGKQQEGEIVLYSAC